MQVAVADWVAARKWGLVKLVIQFSAPLQPAQLQGTSTVNGDEWVALVRCTTIDLPFTFERFSQLQALWDTSHAKDFQL